MESLSSFHIPELVVPFVLFLLAIIMSVLRFAASDYNHHHVIPVRVIHFAPFFKVFLLDFNIVPVMLTFIHRSCHLYT